MAEINWTLRTFMIDELTDYYKNPRSLSEKEFKQLKTSLDKFGMIDKPIVNADSANTIIGGHQRKHVMEASGAKEIECWIPDRVLSEKEVEELNIRLNKNTGSWDFDTLANEFQLDDLLDWGFDKGELDLDLWADDAPEDVEPQIDKAEELRVKWGVESGQLWQLGEHRLMCGDCTDKAVVERVMGEDRAEMVWTDPPYGVAIGDKNKFLNTIAPSNRIEENLENDTLGEPALKEMLERSFDNAIDVCNAGAAWMVASPPRTLLLIFGGVLAERGIWRQTLTWVKNNATFSPLGVCYHWRTEIIFFGWLPNGSHRYYGGRKQDTVWEVDRPVKSPEHPTMKPVELVERGVENHTLPSEVVLDLFVGSGTTLIACERLGRKCRAVEISPAYVAVAIQRWVDVTGGVPVLLGS